MKVGDRIRVTTEGPWLGDTGRIVGPAEQPGYDWAVDIGSFFPCMFSERELEVVQRPIV